MLLQLPSAFLLHEGTFSLGSGSGHKRGDTGVHNRGGKLQRARFDTA